MPGKSSQKAEHEALSNLIPRIFEQAQTSTANHQKNFVALHKAHTHAATRVEQVNDGKSIKLVGERELEDTILDMLARVLPLKKGTTVADRIVKFIGGYVKFINEKAAEEEHDEDEDTFASRFVARLLKYLLRGFVAKDKAVRFRSVYLVAEMVSHLGEIDEEVYTALRANLLERITDKEPSVRIQAVIALSKLCGSEDPDDVAEGEQTATEVLLEVLESDSAAEVRRAALVNIPLSKDVLPTLLARTRDVDTAVRRLVYAVVLDVKNVTHADMLASSAHPRALSIAQRELIVRNGLGDREPAVRAAAGRLLGSWVDAAAAVKEDNEKDPDVMSELITFLGMFDLSEGTVAEDALASVFTTRPELFEALTFGDSFWEQTLGGEQAFLVRVFVQHAILIKDEGRLEAALPVVTALAFRIQSSYNRMLQVIQARAERHRRHAEAGGDEDEDDGEVPERGDNEVDEERIEQEFVLSEMLRLAVKLDYGDEIGRRKMFQLVRDMISQETLPDVLMPRCLDVLRIISPNERDLIRLVVEVVHELRDPDTADDAGIAAVNLSDEVNGDQEFGSEEPATARIARAIRKPDVQSPEERARQDAMDLRCLSLCIGMLERVNGTFEENSTLEGVLRELILPSVKRKEMSFREKGLIALGLCCLIARRMAISSFPLFFSQLQASPEALKIRVLQIVFDMFMVHEGDFLTQGTKSDQIIDFLLRILDADESDNVQALICVGLSKLVLSGMFVDDRVITSLIVKFVSPDTADNQELRQCLSYFFPVYCYSSAANQRRIQQLFVPTFELLVDAFKEMDEDHSTVTIAQITTMFVDWTDPNKVIVVDERAPDDMIHFDLASSVVKALFNDSFEKDDKKALCSMLSKLSLPDIVDEDKARTLKLLVQNVISRRPLRDPASRNALNKFETLISKKYEQQLEGFDEEEFRKLEELKELFEFLDDIFPEDDDEGEKPEPKKRASRKRRSESIGANDPGTPQPSRRRATEKKGSKRRKLSAEGDSDDGSTVHGGSPAPAPRNVPKRAAANRNSIVEVSAESSEGDEDEEGEEEDEGDEEDEDEDGEEARPQPSSSSKRQFRAAQEEEARLDVEINDLLSSDEEPEDSITGSDDEEDEE